MSTYLYKCQECGEFEHEQSIKSPPLEKCPKCELEGKDSGQPTRLIASSSFILNGGGWAKSGYS